LASPVCGEPKAGSMCQKKCRIKLDDSRSANASWKLTPRERQTQAGSLRHENAVASWKLTPLIDRSVLKKVFMSSMQGSESEWRKWRIQWEDLFCKFVTMEMQEADPGHDLAHVRRVVNAAERIGEAEGATANVVLPAAWLHDCVVVPKDSPKRSQASRMAADHAETFLSSIGYESSTLQAIRHAIVAHSFSAKVAPETLEAKVVQDADRLEAMGALGLARCLMTGGTMGTQLVDPEEPFPVNRPADDAVSSVDHLFVKLLRLPQLMQTATGKSMAGKRVAFLEHFLRELADELYIDQQTLQIALQLALKQSN